MHSVNLASFFSLNHLCCYREGDKILLPLTLLGDTGRVTIAGYASGSLFINRDDDTLQRFAVLPPP